MLCIGLALDAFAMRTVLLVIAMLVAAPLARFSSILMYLIGGTDVMYSDGNLVPKSSTQPVTPTSVSSSGHSFVFSEFFKVDVSAGLILISIREA